MDPNDPGTEADALNDILDGEEGDGFLPLRRAFPIPTSVAQAAAERTKLYEVAKAAKVGTQIICPMCGAEHTKTTYHKVFCSNGKVDKSKNCKDKNCKDKFWNSATEERRTRSARYS